MRKDTIYRQWLQRRRSIQVPNNFTGQIMAALDDPRPAFHIPPPPAPAQDAWPEGLARVAAALSLVGVGLFRLAYVSLTLLAP